jgi:phosphatidate phosphatase LPIN
VEFTVNDKKQNLPMKLGEGGEAFFVFETTENIPLDLQTSPLVSPETSPQPLPTTENGTPSLQLPEPEPLDLATDTRRARSASPDKERNGAPIDPNVLAITGQAAAPPQQGHQRPVSGDWSGLANPRDATTRSVTDETLKERRQSLVRHFEKAQSTPPEEPNLSKDDNNAQDEPRHSAVLRATALSKRLWTANIASKVTDDGDLMLDMASYTDSEGDALKLEAMARRILSEELSEEEGGHGTNYDIGSRIGLDEQGNIWVYHSDEAKTSADRRANLQALKYSAAIRSFDAISDPGYHSDEEAGSENGSTSPAPAFHRRDSDSAVGVSTPPDSPSFRDEERPPRKSYAKTLRLTSEQLKMLDLKPGANPMAFTVGKSTCPASLYLWKHDVPIVISDIDGTITKYVSSRSSRAGKQVGGGGWMLKRVWRSVSRKR